MSVVGSWNRHLTVCSGSKMRWKSLVYVWLGLTKSALVSELSWTWTGSMLQPDRRHWTEYDLTFAFVAGSFEIINTLQRRNQNLSSRACAGNISPRLRIIHTQLIAVRSAAPA